MLGSPWGPSESYASYKASTSCHPPLNWYVFPDVSLNEYWEAGTQSGEMSNAALMPLAVKLNWQADWSKHWPGWGVPLIGTVP
jgi:hypothetical protein